MTTGLWLASRRHPTLGGLAPHRKPTFHFSRTRLGAIRDRRETYRSPDRFVGPGSSPGKNEVAG